MQPIRLTTERLLLREWTDQDRPEWAAMNADPRVRAYFPGVQTAAEANRDLDRFQGGLLERGWGWWALATRENNRFVGVAGLRPPGEPPNSGPGPEIGWRLAAEYWGRGYATEAALEVLRWAFETLDAPEVVAFTAEGNARSRAVMRRIGMRHCPGADFDHPAVPTGHPLQPHVTYRLSRDSYRQTQPGPAADPQAG